MCYILDVDRRDNIEKQINKQIKQIEYYLSKIFNTKSKNVSVNCLFRDNSFIDSIEFSIKDINYTLKANKF